MNEPTIDVTERERGRQEKHAEELAGFSNIWDLHPDQAFMEQGVMLQELPKRLEPYFNKYLAGGGHLWKMGAFTAEDIPAREIMGWRIFNPHAHLPLPEKMPKEDRWTAAKMMELGVREVNGAVMFGKENIICVQRLDFRTKVLKRQRKQYEDQFKRTTEATPDQGDTMGYESTVEEDQVEVKPVKVSPKARKPRKPRKPRQRKQKQT